MSVTEQWADQLVHVNGSALSDPLRDKVTRHLFDTIGALLAGLPLNETAALADVSRDLNGGAADVARTGLHGAPGPTILQLCAAVRCTEVDDIHLASCITPSSIIVPVALAVAAQRPDTTGDQFLRACVTGYEAIIRLGLAIDGPGILYKGIWPTYLCAGLGSAATTASLIGLTPAQTAQALAIAAATAASANARSDSPCSKWLMAGTAAQSGALAAFAARRGFLGDLGLLGERWGKLLGIALNDEMLTKPAGEQRHAADLAMKPWCGARQAMSATAGFKRLLETKSLAPESLREITIEVPKAYIQMIDRPQLPASRQESFANLRYQFAIAAYEPDGLYDVTRDDLPTDGRFTALAKTITIRHGTDLDAHYPRHWPARVSIVDGTGAKHVETVLRSPGDAENPLDWNTLVAKFMRVSGRAHETAETIATACRALRDASGLATLVTRVDQAIKTAVN